MVKDTPPGLDTWGMFKKKDGQMITSKSVYYLLGERPISYHPVLAKLFGGAEVAVFLGRLLELTRERNEEWIDITIANLEEDTGLTRNNQATARRKLREAGVLVDEVKGVPATVHYMVNLDVLAARLNDHYGLTDPTPPDTPPPPPDTTQQTSLQEPNKPVCSIPTNQFAGTQQTENQEPSRVQPPQTVQFAGTQQTHIKDDSLKPSLKERITPNKSLQAPQKPSEWLIPAELDTPEFRQAWEEWLNYRKTIRRKSVSSVAGRRQLAQLAKWGVDGAVQSINQSIVNDWQGLFEPKQSYKSAGTKAASPPPMNIDLNQYDLSGVL